MKYIFTILFSLFFATSFAETIANVEYTLPSAAKDWQVGTKFETKEGNTYIYIPKDSQTETSTQFFAVNSNHLPLNLDNIAVVNAIISKFFPNMQLELKQIDKGDKNATYEWSVKRDNEEKIHGWGRVFVGGKEGVVVLVYQTRNVADLEAAKAIWLPVIKDAKVVEVTAPAAATPAVPVTPAAATPAVSVTPAIPAAEAATVKVPAVKDPSAQVPLEAQVK